MDILKGYKAKIGAVATIFTGLGMMLTAFIQDETDWQQINAGWMLILAGWTAFGFRDAMPTD